EGPQFAGGPVLPIFDTPSAPLHPGTVFNRPVLALTHKPERTSDRGLGVLGPPYVAVAIDFSGATAAFKTASLTPAVAQNIGALCQPGDWAGALVRNVLAKDKVFVVTPPDVSSGLTVSSSGTELDESQRLRTGDDVA